MIKSTTKSKLHLKVTGTGKCEAEDDLFNTEIEEDLEQISCVFDIFTGTTKTDLEVIFNASECLLHWWESMAATTSRKDRQGS